MSKLTAKQEQAALALAQGQDRETAAEAIGVSAQTLTRWKREIPAFKERIDELITELLEDLQPKALRVMGAELDNPNPWLRYNAAREILTRCNVALDKAESEVTVKVIGMPELGMPPGDAEMAEA